MDFTYPAEAEAFRTELRGWLVANLADEHRGLSGVLLDPSPDDLAAYRQWLGLLADAGYAAISWPRALGGRAADGAEQAVYAEEMDRAGAPPHLNALGMSTIAPAIITYGTDAQQRDLLPRTASCSYARTRTHRSTVASPACRGRAMGSGARLGLPKR